MTGKKLTPVKRAVIYKENIELFFPHLLVDFERDNKFVYFKVFHNGVRIKTINLLVDTSESENNLRLISLLVEIETLINS